MQHSQLESLPPRLLFATISVLGTSSADTVLVYPSGSNTVAALNGSVVQTVATASLTAISIDVGAGNDVVDIDAAVTAPSTIAGGNGNDSLSGGAGRDFIGGGNNNDTIYGNTNVDSLYGDDGDDVLDGGGNSDYFYPGRGFNWVIGGSGGGDVIDYTGYSDDVYVGINVAGATLAIRSSADDSTEMVLLGSGDDRVQFSYWDNPPPPYVPTLHARITPVTVGGGAGNDVIIGGSANDSLDGGSNNDFIGGMLGNDTMQGGAGSDSMGYDSMLMHEPGDDYFLALDGIEDTLFGGDDNDSGSYDLIDNVNL